MITRRKTKVCGEIFARWHTRRWTKAHCEILASDYRRRTKIHDEIFADEYRED